MGEVTVDHLARQLSAGEVRELLHAPEGATDVGVVFWRAWDKGCRWFTRSSRIPSEEFQAALWLLMWDKADRVARAWNAAGEAGLIKTVFHFLFRFYKDYRHHKKETCVGLLGEGGYADGE